MRFYLGVVEEVEVEVEIPVVEEVRQGRAPLPAKPENKQERRMAKSKFEGFNLLEDSIDFC